jgi:hypothetical protein
VKGECPCGRECSECVYEKLCGGCLEDGCVHVRKQESKVNRSQAKCLFCEMKHIDDSCPTLNPPPPKQFKCLGPWVLEETIASWNYERDEVTENPPEPDWPLIIPEVSDITETTSRLGVYPDEGDWNNEQWNPIAWDMTGYLFDKIQGAPWVRDPELHQEEDWHFILGTQDNWIDNILLIDRLPDRLAIQTPPSAIMVAYLNRLYSYHWKLILDDDAPHPWLLTHGYPSYIDWPPAWHWNLGIRMLSSLAAYVGSQGIEMMGVEEGTWYPDKRKQTEFDRAPCAYLDDGNRLLYEPDSTRYGPTEMDWDTFPGIIPFIPGADTNQLTWFTKQIQEMGYTTVALDAVNSIAHENFKGLNEAVTAVRKGGAKHVIINGPWPLHPPSNDIPIHHVSYIPTALHMDMTNRPPRYWHSKKEKPDGTKRKWQRLPNYRKANLAQVHHLDYTDICDCRACQAAKVHETDPRSIWRWGHMLHAGLKWQNRMEKKREQKEPELADENIRLWYQGPSYMVFRKCLHYPSEIKWSGIEDILETLVFTETKMEIKFPDGFVAPSYLIHWTWSPEGHTWEWEFPLLED